MLTTSSLSFVYQSLCFNKPTEWFWCLLKFETPRSSWWLFVRLWDCVARSLFFFPREARNLFLCEISHVHISATHSNFLNVLRRLTYICSSQICKLWFMLLPFNPWNNPAKQLWCYSWWEEDAGPNSEVLLEVPQPGSGQPLIWTWMYLALKTLPLLRFI